MANIRKSFNFRNGVQVDTDNFIVNALGLVGIGTTIPSQSLDVVGNIKATGITSTDILQSNELSVAQATISNINLEQSIIGAGFSIVSGIITHTGSGIVTYYGDGRFLQGLPTSQWLDIDVGLGFTSIYNVGYVGVSTNDPRFTLQIGGSNQSTYDNFTLEQFVEGVGISSRGTIVGTGSVTAYEFVGYGSHLSLLDANNITSGTISNDHLPILDNDRLPSNISISGILTATTEVETNLVDASIGDITSLTVGIATAQTKFVGYLWGVAAYASGLQTSRTINDVSFDGTENIVVEPYLSDDTSLNNPSPVTFNPGTVAAGYGSLSKSSNFVYNPALETLTVGVVSATSSLRTPFIGIGTNNSLSSSSVEILEQIKSANLRLISPNNSSLLYLGKNNSLNDDGAAFRYGNIQALFDYSTENSLDLINYGDGNFNFYLEASDPLAGINTGSFYWHRGSNNNQLMALTYEGYLGIGLTDPINPLHVSGIATITGDTFIDGTLYSNSLVVNADSTFKQDLAVNGQLTAGTFSVNILSGNVNATSGVSTFNNVHTTNFMGVGVLEGARPQALVPDKFAVNSPGSAYFCVDTNGSIGIKTDDMWVDGINAQSTTLLTRAVGVGTTRPMCVLDFKDASNQILGGEDIDKVAYMIPPRLTTTQRNALTNINQTGVEEGAMIYNIDTKKLQVYDGTIWNDCF